MTLTTISETKDWYRMRDNVRAAVSALTVCPLCDVVTDRPAAHVCAVPAVPVLYGYVRVPEPEQEPVPAGCDRCGSGPAPVHLGRSWPSNICTGCADVLGIPYAVPGVRS